MPKGAWFVVWLLMFLGIGAAVPTASIQGEEAGLGSRVEAGSSKPVLTSLTVSAGTLTPAFSSEIVDYTVPDVPYGTRLLTITATPETGGTVIFWHYVNGELEVHVDEDEDTAGHQVTLGVGKKTVEVDVSKGNGKWYRIYKLDITRLKATVSIRAISEAPLYEGDTLKFEISRSAAAADFLAVWVLATEKEATAGKGHANLLPDSIDGQSPPYNIEGGDSTATIEIATNGDKVWEGHSHVEMTIVIRSGSLYTIDDSGGTATLIVQDDEFLASTGVLTVSPNPVGEGAGGTTATVTVTTTGDKVPHGEASVTVETSDGTATAGSDYTGVDTSVKLTESDFSQVTVDGNTRHQATKTADVSITQDTVDEEDETFSIDASTDSGSPISIGEDDSTVSVTITDDDEPPPTLTSLTVGAGTLTPTFSSDTLSYTVPDVGAGTNRLTITAGAASGTTVAFFDSSNNALADLDTTAEGHQVALGIGVTEIKIRVTKGSGSQDYSLTITRGKPTVSVKALTTGSATEGDKIQFEVKRSASAGDTLAVKFTLDEVGVSAGVSPGDVLPDSKEDTTQTVTIAANKTKATVEVTTTADSTWENHSNIELEIEDDDSYTVHATKDTATILVKDDEFVASTAALSVSPDPVGEGDGKTTATVTVTTSSNKKPHGQVTIQVTTSDGTATAGSDFTALNASLSFAEGDFSGVTVDGNSRFRAVKSVDVVILQDTLDDEDETFSVALGTPTDPLVKPDANAKTESVEITDDELPRLTALSVSPGTLTPAFSYSQTSYTVPDVGYGNHRLTISATGEHGASVSYLDSSNKALTDLDDKATGHQVSLGIGDTTVKVRLEEDGLSQDYALVITRAKPTVNVEVLTTSPATEGDKIQFEVERSASAGDTLAVKFTLEEVGTSKDVIPGDVLPDSEEGTTQTATIAADKTKATVEVTTTADSTWENHSNIELEISVDDSYTIHDTKGSASVLVKDDEFVASTAKLSVAPDPVGEGAGKTTATVTVTTEEDKKPHGQVSIPVTTSEGTATSGEDFTALNADLSFAEGDFSGVKVSGDDRFRATKSVDVVILQDTLDDEDETFSVALGTPTDPLVKPDANAKTESVEIIDDELPRLTALSVSPGTLTPTFSYSQTSYTIPDIGYGTHLATINATPESGAEVSFLDSTDNEYDDLDDEADGHQVYARVGSTTIKIKVEEDGTEQVYTLVFTRAKPTVSIQRVTSEPATEGDTLSFEVSRATVAGDVLDVRVGVDEVDIVEGEGHGNILPDHIEGNSPLYTIEEDESSLVFTIDTQADSVWEKHSKIEMTIKSEAWYDIDSNKSSAGIVVRDDEFVDSVAKLSVSPNPVGEGAGKTVATVTVTTDDDKKPHGEASVTVATSDGTAKAGSDYTGVDTSVKFTESDFSSVTVDGNTRYQATKTVEVSITQDTVDEENETFSISASTDSGSPISIGRDDSTVSVTITDDDEPPPTVSVRALTTGAATEGDKVKFEVARSESAGDTLAVKFTLDEIGVSAGVGPGDVLDDSQEGITKSVTIAASKTKATVEVTTTSDSVWENHSKIELEIEDDDSYTVHDKKDAATILVRDDEFVASVAVLAISPNPVEETGEKVVATVTVTTKEDKKPHGQVSIPLSTSDGTAKANEDYTPVSGSLVFKEEDFDEVEEDGDTLYRVFKTLEIPILDDSLDEDDETFNVEMGKPSQSVVERAPGSSSVSVRINDQNSSPVVTVSTTPSPAEVPGRGTVTLDGTSSDSDEEDTLTYAWTVAPANVGSFGDAASEDTTWTAPAPLAVEQSATLTLTVTDDGTPTGTKAVDVEVTVRANQAPTVEVATAGGVVPGGSTLTLGAGVTDPEEGELTYEWSGGGSFGDASVKDATWTAPATSDEAQEIVLTLTVTDELGLTGEGSVEITVPATNRKPYFPGSETGERSIDEGVTSGGEAGAPVTAIDADNDDLNYSLGGEDAGLFSIDSAGQIRYVGGTALNYEAKESYEIVVSVSDRKDETSATDESVDATKAVVISVADLEEEGVITFSLPYPDVGVLLNASVSDGDNYTASNTSGAVDDAYITSWTWERSDDGGDPWSAIAGARSAGYVPTVKDMGKFLRVTVSYADRRGHYKKVNWVLGWVGAGIPYAPTIVSMTYNGQEGGLEVTWLPPTNNGGDQIIDYWVEWKQSGIPGCPAESGWTGEGASEDRGECYAVVNGATVLGTSHVITGHDGAGLVEGGSYNVRVSAGNSVGFGAWSKVVTARVPSLDATLKSLAVSPVDISGFNPHIYSYATTISDAANWATVTARAASEKATVDFGPDVDADPVESGHQVILVPGENAIAVTVTAEDGVTNLEYSIVITWIAGNMPSSVYVWPYMATTNDCNAVMLGGKSIDGEGDALTYPWIANPNADHFADDGKEGTACSALDTGEYPLTAVLTLIGSDGSSGTDTGSESDG